MKKILIFMLVAAMMLSLTGCTESKPEVTLNIKTTMLPMAGVVDPEVTDAYSFLLRAGEAFAAQYEDADVTINVAQFDKARENEEIAGRFDTEYAADVFYERYFNMSTYVYMGRVVPLDDIISDAMRKDISERYWNVSSVDGKTYMMPFISMQNTMCYNKKLFREAGLDEFISDGDVVQSWTLEEWEFILATLREKLPSIVFPMAMYAANDQGDTHIMTLLRSRGCSFFDENGRVAVNTPEGLEALQWIRDSYDKGYFPPHAETLVLMDNNDLFTADQLGIYFCNISLCTLYEEAGMDIGFVNFPSPDGKGYSTSFVTGFEVFDNGDEETVKAAKAFVKFIYETEWLDYSAGSIPVSRRVSEQYADQLEATARYIDNRETSINFTNNSPNWRGVRAAFYEHIQDLFFDEKPIEQVAQELQDACNAAIEEGYANSTLHE